jgi:DNA polymerase-3 subunit delta'
MNIEHPDLHLYVPLPRPKGVSGDRLADALEAARGEALAELRQQPLRPSQGDELRGLYLGMVQSLRRRAHLRPTMSTVQIFILGDAELLVPQESSPEAANALLKLLEEPPRSTHFILTSSEPGRLLPTIRSRTVPLHLAPLPIDEVATFLTGVAGVEPDLARRAAELSRGSIGRALGFLPDAEGAGHLEALRQQALDLVEASLQEGRGPGYAAALSFPPAGARNLIELFSFVEECLGDVAAVACGAEERIVGKEALPRLRALIERSGVEAAEVAAALRIVEESRAMARGNVNPQLIVSDLVRRLHAALRPARLARTRR